VQFHFKLFLEDLEVAFLKIAPEWEGLEKIGPFSMGTGQTGKVGLARPKIHPKTVPDDLLDFWSHDPDPEARSHAQIIFHHCDLLVSLSKGVA
jgi:hypothetical protein